MDSCVLPETGASVWVIVVLAAAALVGGVVAVRLGRRRALPVVIAVALAVGVMVWAAPARAASNCPPTTTAPSTSLAPVTSTTEATTTIEPSTTTTTTTTLPTTTSTSTTTTSTSTSTSTTTTSTSTTTTTTLPLQRGSVQIRKVVDDPGGGYVGGTSKTFSGTYNCGPGFSGTYSTLTTAAPFTVAGVPVGRICAITENTPTGGLLNASFAWGTPTVSAPVEIVDQGLGVVTITNTVIQA